MRLTKRSCCYASSGLSFAGRATTPYCPVRFGHTLTHNTVICQNRSGGKSSNGRWSWRKKAFYHEISTASGFPAEKMPPFHEEQKGQMMERYTESWKLGSGVDMADVPFESRRSSRNSGNSRYYRVHGRRRSRRRIGARRRKRREGELPQTRGRARRGEYPEPTAGIPVHRRPGPGVEAFARSRIHMYDDGEPGATFGDQG
ncbi:hypothetical protein QC762_0050280 [Podospora pseudocomata]|uniref:Uncharacterized protein n=1 Tax=Podospora pseudocomata TaxID=2093779 RepID=A0ABR0GIH3_9PEZI|nr:hypothetical protein QC762_0050280 [Podospora pseudocomata]